MITLAACIGAAVNLLAIFCITQARLHTISSPKELTTYNSSASAVCGIWLFFQVYVVNVARAANPRLQFAVIVFSIFAMVTCTYGVQFPTMTYGSAFISRLLEGFLTGFGLAAAVGFLVFPTSSRKVVFKEMTGYLMCLNGMLKAQTKYMQDLESFDPEALRQKHEEQMVNNSKHTKHESGKHWSALDTPASLALKGVFEKTVGLLTKLNADVTPAKREFAIGKLESHDITELWKLLRLVFVPVLGLSTSIDITRRRAEEQHWTDAGVTDQEKKSRHQQLDNLHFLMKQLHEPFATLTG